MSRPIANCGNRARFAASVKRNADKTAYSAARTSGRPAAAKWAFQLRQLVEVQRARAPRPSRRSGVVTSSPLATSMRRSRYATPRSRVIGYFPQRTWRKVSRSSGQEGSRTPYPCCAVLGFSPTTRTGSDRIHSRVASNVSVIVMARSRHTDMRSESSKAAALRDCRRGIRAWTRLHTPSPRRADTLAGDRTGGATVGLRSRRWR